MADRLRIAYTLEQCWHPVPGGTAVAALEVARRLAEHPAVDLVAVAGRHRRPPADGLELPSALARLPLARPWLYETWNRWGRPRVERTTGPIDVCHSTVAIPAATAAPHVVTVHDVAFVHTPERFTRHGVRVMTAGLDRCRTADRVLCPSAATRDELVELGFDAARIRVVPWGVEPVPVSEADVARVRAAHRLPERFVLFVGTVEPRKNLPRLAAAVAGLEEPIPLVVAGSPGWGHVERPGGEVHFLGHVPAGDLPALYSAATVFGYPSEHEGFGLPVAEAMAQGTPVVTSRGTACEEVAAGAAVLVDPPDVDAIAGGLASAIADRRRYVELGRRRAAELDWGATVDATVDAYREVAR